MLRVIKKRRLQQEEASLAGSDTKATVPNMRIVSHIPMTSKASVSSLSSTESSFSSAQYHPFQSLSKRSDDQTYDGEPPVVTGTVTLGSELSSSDSTTVSETSSVIKLSPNAPPALDIPPMSRLAISVVSGDLRGGSNKGKRQRSEISSSLESPSEVSRPGRLLFTSKDTSILSPLHIFVRQQIEVFEATEDDLKQPAPGRRIPIQPNQGKDVSHLPDPACTELKLTLCTALGIFSGHSMHSLQTPKGASAKEESSLLPIQCGSGVSLGKVDSEAPQ
jgi:hypothetical protein